MNFSRGLGFMKFSERSYTLRKGFRVCQGKKCRGLSDKGKDTEWVNFYCILLGNRVYSGSTEDGGQPWKMRRRPVFSFMHLFCLTKTSSPEKVFNSFSHQSVSALHPPPLRTFALAFQGNNVLFQKVQDKNLITDMVPFLEIVIF